MYDPGAHERPDSSRSDGPEHEPRREHEVHVGHMHVHDVDCGHPTVVHGLHVDYVHDDHRHASHGTHYDEH